MPKHLTILGSTGSIGKNTLAVVARFPDKFKVAVLTAKSNVELLAEQIRRFKPRMAVVYSADNADRLKKELGPETGLEIAYGEAGYCAAASLEGVQTVVSAMVGAAGLKPTLAAIEAQKTVALANKETLVMAGEIVMRKVAENNVDLLPVDSEHSAIFQCLLGNRKSEMQKIFLTASGGPFFETPRKELREIPPEAALRHPNWAMGPKITIDSATLMNKGLEVIEAKHLFGISEERIEVVIHRQSVIHSMVAFQDGSVMAQLGIPDMKQAIAFALSYPQRLPLDQPLPDFNALSALTFAPPDTEKFPCLKLAYDACRTGGTLPAMLNAANEVAVQAYLEKRIFFGQIPEIIRVARKAHPLVEKPTLDDILRADSAARKTAADCIAGL